MILITSIQNGFYLNHSVYNPIKQNICFFRTQNKSILKTGLSKDDKILRRRKVTVSIQMTMLSWSLEAISGITAFLLIFTASRDDDLEPIAVILILLNLMLYYIFVPISYLINTEVLKALILAKGWFNWSKSFILSPFARRSAQVAPEPDNNQEE